jgi:hypothetical protein
MSEIENASEIFEEEPDSRSPEEIELDNALENAPEEMRGYLRLMGRKTLQQLSSPTPFPLPRPEMEFKVLAGSMRDVFGVNKLAQDFQTLLDTNWMTGQESVLQFNGFFLVVFRRIKDGSLSGAGQKMG